MILYLSDCVFDCLLAGLCKDYRFDLHEKNGKRDFG